MARRTTVGMVAWAAVAVIAVGTAVWAGAGLVRVRTHIGSFSDAMFSVMFAFEDSTKWAPGFSEVQFDRVRVGMREEEVRALVGRPLGERRSEDGEHLLLYTQGPLHDPTNWWMRYVVVGPDGRVVRVGRELSVD
jgi:hypothetical protein